MHNLHKLDISAYNSRFSRKKSVSHNRRVFISVFQIYMGMPFYNYTFLPKCKYTLLASFMAKTKGKVIGMEHRVDKGYRRITGHKNVPWINREKKICLVTLGI